MGGVVGGRGAAGAARAGVEGKAAYILQGGRPPAQAVQEALAPTPQADAGSDALASAITDAFGAIESLPSLDATTQKARAALARAADATLSALPEQLSQPSLAKLRELVESTTSNANFDTSSLSLEGVSLASFKDFFAHLDLDAASRTAVDAILRAAQLTQSAVTTNSTAASLLVAAVTVALATHVTFRLVSSPYASSSSGMALTKRWDPDAAEAYFARRPVRVATRIAEIAAVAAPFLINLWLDRTFYHAHDGEDTTWPLPKRSRAHRQAERGRELTKVLAKLGPTFIKVGQSLSIREDLLPPEYTSALRELQDRLPPFDEALSREILRQEWKVANAADVLTVLDANGNAVPQDGGKPIAAASLGQVYRGFLTLDDGTPKQVAVKVQRPKMAEVIALDLYLLRAIAQPVREWQNLNTDLEGVVDEWGRGFTQELDYVEEGASAERFTQSMRDAGIDSVRAPRVITEYTTERVLVTEWIDGVRLDEAGAEAAAVAEVDGMNASTVPRLCGVALLSYLTMLLDVGLLHSDPHPGNLLVDRSDGALVILDWGLVTYVSPEKQIAILEYVAHLANDEWAAIPNDLVAMGFVPESKLDVVTKEPEVLEAISLGLKALVKGGGAQNIKSNVSVVADELNYARKRYGNVFQIPSYFAYILRAFAILEGICLKIDPKYAIVSECYPYLARRLFTDKDPRVVVALESLLYGAEPLARPGEPAGRQLNIARLERLVGAYRRSAAYAAEQSAAEGTAEGSEAPARAENSRERWSIAAAEARVKSETLSVDPGALEILRLVLSQEETHLQKLVVYEAARAIDALSREALLAVAAGTLPRWPGAALPASFVMGDAGGRSPFGGLLPNPFASAVALNQEDVETLDTVRRLANLFFPDPSGAQAPGAPNPVGMLPPPPTPFDAAANGAAAVRNATAAAMLAGELLPELVPGALTLGGRLAMKLQERAMDRLLRG